MIKKPTAIPGGDRHGGLQGGNTTYVTANTGGTRSRLSPVADTCSTDNLLLVSS